MAFDGVSRVMVVDLVKLAHESGTGASFESGFLALLGREIGFDAAFFFAKGHELSPTIVGLDRKTTERVIARSSVYSRELLPVTRAALAARGVAVDTDVCGLRQVRQAKYFREIASTLNGQHSLLAYVPWRGRIVATFMLGRTGKGFSHGEVRAVESLLPGLGVARAALGLSPVAEPLPTPPRGSLFRRLGFAHDTRVLASVPIEGGTLVVRDRAGFREMVASDGSSELVWTRAALTGSGQSGWPYVELFHLAPALAKQRCYALFVGSGGAVGLRQFANVYPGMSFDLVEHEPAVIELARSWFGLGTIPNLTVHIGDGAEYISCATPSSWDIVVVDAYDTTNFAAKFSQRPFLTALRRGLRPGGSVACNIIGTLSGRGPVSDFVSAVRPIFERVRILPVVDLDESFSGDALRNVVVIATRGT